VVGLVAVYLIWGSTYIAMDVAIAAMPPMLLMAARFALAGAALYVFAIRRGDRDRDRPTLRQWWHATLTGGVMLVGGTGLISLAMVWIGAGTTALLSATVPVWLALFARLAFRDRLSTQAWLGLGLGVVGVAVLVDPAGGGLAGMGLAVLGAMAWAGGSLRSRVAPAPNRPLVAASMEMLGASVVFLLVAVALREPAALDLAAIDIAAVASAIYLGTAGSIVAFTAYRWLLANAPTPLVGTHAYVNPIVAVILAWLLLGERLEGRALLAAGVILASVVLVVTARPHEPVPAQATSGGDVFAGVRRWRRVVRWPLAPRGRTLEAGPPRTRPHYLVAPHVGNDPPRGSHASWVEHPRSRRRLRWARRSGPLARRGRGERHRQARDRRARDRRPARRRG
jgi:drug/metabolite transporter (DMT)-like permease